jgi:hypothetical protein
MASVGTTVSVTTGAPALLWQTSTGVSPDPQTTLAGNATAQIYRAGTFNTPIPILIRNEDTTHTVTLGGSTVTSGSSVTLRAGESLTFNAVGNDSLYAIANTNTVTVSVLVQKQ